MDDVRATLKRRDSWWTVFLVDPLACRVALVVANRTEITPNGLTRFSLVLGMASAACFAAGRLALGAALFYLSFMIDCVDGKIARLKGTGTPFGLWLDYVGDRIRVVCCAAGIAYGQYAATGEMAYVLLGAGIAVLDLFRYVNAPQMKRVRQTVRTRRRAARRAELIEMRDAMALEWLDQEYEDQPLQPGSPYDVPDQDAEYPEWPEPGFSVPRQAPGGSETLASLRRDELSHAPPSSPSGGGDEGSLEPGTGEPRLGRRQRVYQFLLAHRVRTHVWSGIEFHAAVFVLAPLAGPPALLPVTTAAGALLVVNEIFLVYRMWLSTRTVPAKAVPAARNAAEQPVRTDPFFTGV
ncbi:CDP-alcohol phosphatidyltransferase family protein [Sphaerisporangium sp. TRM90804]|uniref:CDP-alcohol phosphatidyltransferase family protein n=1 Tax=Sphaerisporangium sp. TRM90804 TaxID=3031113 RepID=UPI00244910E8|nr:CDP-alcohol phosphatidyltransferase family protein [Sphaerisporangium sp. TRM90804]MDH2423869.1 CDP-alcohol phosphatidyltransferase family protein [Sphaerisporangium sp. TRM90804]